MQAKQYEGTVTLAEIWNPISATIPSVTSGSGGTITVALPAGSQALPGDVVSLGCPAAWGPLQVSGTIIAQGSLQIAYGNNSGSTVNVGAQPVGVAIERLVLTGV